MVINHRNYVPVLKWKLGEYQALTRLDDATKARVVPLIEISPIGYDFENEAPSTTPETHLSTFGTRLKAKWGSRPCFLDMKYIGYDLVLGNGQHALGYTLARARENQGFVIPVVPLEAPASFVLALKAALALDKRGICLRLVATDADRDSLQEDIEELLAKLGVGKSEVDVVLDLGATRFPSSKMYIGALTDWLEQLGKIALFRSITVVGCSYPESITQTLRADQLEFLPRQEWTLYKTLLEDRVRKGLRIPTFGDYGISHPDPLEFDMRLVKPLAKLRYTKTDEWFVELGLNVRTYGFDQFREMCQKLVKRPFFDGPSFCAGDKYIADCAEGNETTGNLGTWTWVSTNRHISKVVYDLANLPGT